MFLRGGANWTQGLQELTFVKAEGKLQNQHLNPMLLRNYFNSSADTLMGWTLPPPAHPEVALVTHSEQEIQVNHSSRLSLSLFLYTQPYIQVISLTPVAQPGS